MQFLIPVLVVTVIYLAYRALGKKKLQSPITSNPVNPTPDSTCKEYYNNTGSPINGVAYTTCSGENLVNQLVEPGQSIFAQEGTVIVEDGNFLTQL